MIASRLRRFYSDVQVRAVEGEFVVALDGRGLKTPAGNRLALPTAALAEAVASEWGRQEKNIDPTTMGVTRIVGTGLDLIADNREPFTRGILRFAETDLLCYRADAPTDLVVLQAKVWDPLLEWAVKRLGARMNTTSGVVPVSQPATTLSVLEAHVSRFDAIGLSALISAVEACGSLIMGLALAEGRIEGNAAFDAAQLDETYQMEKWGCDMEAVRRRDRLRADILVAETVLCAIREIVYSAPSAD